MKRVLLVVLAVALAGCASGTADPLPRAAVTVAHLTSPPRDLFHVLLRHSRDLGPLPARTVISTLIYLRDPATQRQTATLAAMYNPRSPAFGRYASARSWETSGLSTSRVARLRAQLQRVGIHSQWIAGSSALLLHGQAGSIARLFGVRLERYAPPHGPSFWAARGTPAVPRWLRAVAGGIGRLTNYSDRTAQIIPSNGLTPGNMLAAYDMLPLRNRHIDGSGVTVSFLEIDGFHQSDLDGFTSHFGLPPMRPQIMMGGSLSNVDGEAELDMEVVHEIAPGARLRVYNCGGSCSDTDFIQMENRAVHDTPGGVISISIGGCEPAEASSSLRGEAAAFNEADALGESVFVASGDSGAFECLTQNWGAAPTVKYAGTSSPAVVPGVTAVGGTRLSLTSAGAWYAEQAWDVPPQTAGTGGGISTVFRRPTWQRGPGVNNQYDPQGMREVPDVSADADSLTSARIDVNGSFDEVGGTSQAAPIWAGMTALLDGYLRSLHHRTPGFLNPALYTLAAGHVAYPPFHDVTLGNNLLYPATPGYDLATGLGTPDAWNLARDLAAYLSGKHR